MSGYFTHQILNPCPLTPDFLCTAAGGNLIGAAIAIIIFGAMAWVAGK
jgi:hypothetical protein